jgi:hypothetical protein
MIAIAEKPYRALTPRESKPFLSFVPSTTRQAEIAFQQLRLQEREEAVAEVLAIAFAAFHRLVERGKLHAAFASALARFAVARVRCGRRAGGRPKAGDAMSRHALSGSGLTIESLDEIDCEQGELRAGLIEDRRAGRLLSLPQTIRLAMGAVNA